MVNYRAMQFGRVACVAASLTFLTVAPVWAEPDDWEERMQLDISQPQWKDDRHMDRAAVIVDAMDEKAKAIGRDDVPYRTDSVEIGAAVPSAFKPWWHSKVVSQLNPNSNAVVETPESLVLRAIANSAQIKVFSDIPVIRETAELEARGRFDTHLYAEGRHTDLDEPVGSELTTGGPERLLEDEWLWKLGLRKKFVTGTEVDLSQRMGVRDNNSEFFVPADQANTRVALTITQPLLNGAGVRYNRSTLDLARIDANVALDEFKRQVESHLLEVMRAYWGLWLERSALVQRRKVVDDTSLLVSELENRSSLDATGAQLSRARSELVRRKSDVVRSESAVRNAEARILSLINDPSLKFSEGFELIPEVSPTLSRSEPRTETAIAMAMENRSEIKQSFKQLRAAGIRADMSKRELQPVLNLVLQYYRDGLAGEGDTSRALDNQWDDGDGSFVVGLVFDFPIGNRAAKARHKRRQVEVRQLSEQLRTTLETVLLELQVSTREVKTAWRDLQGKYLSLEAVEDELSLLRDRRDLELTDGSNGADYIERLLDAQDRMVIAQFDYLQSEVSYNVALVNLDRSTGTLLQAHNIGPERIEEGDDGLPAWRMRPLTGN